MEIIYSISIVFHECSDTCSYTYLNSESMMFQKQRGFILNI